MKYRKWLVVGLMTLGLNGSSGMASDGKGYEISVPMHMINDTIREKFPQSKQTNYGTLMIEKPNVLSHVGSDRLEVDTLFRFSSMLLQEGIQGRVLLSSGIHYNPSDRGLYLAKPMIEELNVQNFKLSKYLTPEIKNLIKDAIVQQLGNKPIYNMNNVSLLVKDVGIQNGNVVVTVGL